MKLLLSFFVFASALPGLPEEPMAPIVLGRSVNPGDVLAEADLSFDRDDARLQAQLPAFIGKEARRRLPAGTPLRDADFRTATLVGRNSAVRMEFIRGPLRIAAQGRALADGGVGDDIKVINLESKSVVTATIVERGKVVVQ